MNELLDLMDKTEEEKIRDARIAFRDLKLKTTKSKTSSGGLADDDSELRKLNYVYVLTTIIDRHIIVVTKFKASSAAFWRLLLFFVRKKALYELTSNFNYAGIIDIW